MADAEIPLSEDENTILEEADGKIMLFHLSGPIRFSSAKAMVRRHAVLPATRSCCGT
ncbi:MAG: hypothetical protein WBO34_03010 [Gammaproteobacteria bacterium]